MQVSFIVFVQFSAVLHNQVSRFTSSQQKNKLDIIGTVTRETSQWGMSVADRLQLREYLTNPKAGLKVDVNVKEAELKHSVQVLYELVCGALGPVDTDKLFASSIRKVSESKAAQQYPPHRLL